MTVFGSTPCRSSHVACVCRSVWNDVPLCSPSSSRRPENQADTADGLKNPPSASQQTPSRRTSSPFGR